MPVQILLFWLILDPITFGLGSIGAYLVFIELSTLDSLPSIADLIVIVKKRKLAVLALAVAVIYFFYRLFAVINI